MNLKAYAKSIFVMGIIISFLSFFFDWYSFQGKDLEGELVLSWNLHLLIGWTTPFSPDAWFNEVFKPSGEQIPPVIAIIYILISIIVVYSVIFADLENSESLQKNKKYSYFHIFQLLLSCFYICIVPIYYWIFQEYFFPYVIFVDFELEVRFIYSIGIGYLLQCISFIAIFPYSIHYYYTTTHFENRAITKDLALQDIINQSQELIDFDKLIAEENLRLQLEDEKKQSNEQSDEQFNQIYHQFVKTREIK